MLRRLDFLLFTEISVHRAEYWLFYRYLGTFGQPLTEQVATMIPETPSALPEMGQRLKQARKATFPMDDLSAFALRLGVSRSTLQRMEQGDLSVSLSRYYRAAELLNMTQGFDQLFIKPESLFDD